MSLTLRPFCTQPTIYVKKWIPKKKYKAGIYKQSSIEVNSPPQKLRLIRKKYFTSKNWKTHKYFCLLGHILWSVSLIWYLICENWVWFNPRPPEVFFVTRPPKGGGLLQLPLWIFYTERRLIPLYLLPLYRYGSPPSIYTKMSTIKLHMTSLWRYKVSALSQIWLYWKLNFYVHENE